MSKTITTVPAFQAQLETDRELALRNAQAAVRPPADQDVVERATAARLEARAIAASDLGLGEPPQPGPRRVIEQWVDVDMLDLKTLKSLERREQALGDVDTNRLRAADYDADLKSRYADVSLEVDAFVRLQEQRQLVKDARKWRDYEVGQLQTLGDHRPEQDFADRVAGDRRVRERQAAQDRALDRLPAGVIVLATEAPMARKTTTTSNANAMREEDRARLEAFMTLERQKALQKYPEFRRAYELQDASNEFRKQRLRDPETSAAFQKLTDEFIRQRLGRGEDLPAVRRRRAEQDLERAPERSRVREVEIDR